EKVSATRSQALTNPTVFGPTKRTSAWRAWSTRLACFPTPDSPSSAKPAPRTTAKGTRARPHAARASAAWAAGRPIQATSGGSGPRVAAGMGGRVPDRPVARVQGIEAPRVAMALQEVERAGAGAREVAGHADQRDRPRSKKAPETRGLAPRRGPARRRHGAN